MPTLRLYLSTERLRSIVSRATRKPFGAVTSSGNIAFIAVRASQSESPRVVIALSVHPLSGSHLISSNSDSETKLWVGGHVDSMLVSTRLPPEKEFNFSSH